jgi:hypothetical protein
MRREYGTKKIGEEGGVLARKTRDVIDQRGGFLNSRRRDGHEGKEEEFSTGERERREGKWDDLHGLIAKARVAFFTDSGIGD